MLLRLPHFDIPLILRKSDGGYGYDSTDMAAVKYRCMTLKRFVYLFVCLLTSAICILFALT